jgi:hypothetical protein
LRIELYVREPEEGRSFGGGNQAKPDSIVLKEETAEVFSLKDLRNVQ